MADMVQSYATNDVEEVEREGDDEDPSVTRQKALVTQLTDTVGDHHLFKYM